MKRKRAIILLVCMCIVCIFAGMLAACGGGEQDYTSNSAPYAEGNYGVEITFELEGGTYQNSTRHVRMYYYIRDGMETHITPPGENSKRELNRANYYITGWYRTRTENPDGTVTYSDEWDFEKDTVKSGDEGFTLYCGWAPKIVHTYEICYYDENGAEQVYGKIQVNAGDPFSDSSDRADNRVGYTAKREANEAGEYEICYYSGKDENGNWIPWDPAFTHPGGETSTAVKVFVDYLKGDFKYVSTASELISASKNYANTDNGVYLTQDIDLGGEELPIFRKGNGDFKGVFYGNGYTVKNFILKYDVNNVISNRHALLEDKALCISLFGNLEGATVRDVTFEGVEINIDINYDQINGVYVAPLAVLANSSSVEGVNISGSITVNRVNISNVNVFEYEIERLFWQTGVYGNNCTVNMTFIDNRT